MTSERACPSGMAASHPYTEPGTRCRASEVTRAPTSGIPFSSTKHICTGDDVIVAALADSGAERGDAQPTRNRTAPKQDTQQFGFIEAPDVCVRTPIQPDARANMLGLSTCSTLSALFHALPSLPAALTLHPRAKCLAPVHTRSSRAPT